MANRGRDALAALAAGIFLLHTPTSHAARAGHTLVSTAKTSLGRVLVNSRGHTLYLFGKDRNGQERMLRAVRVVLAAADCERQAGASRAARRRRCSGRSSVPTDAAR